MARAVVPALTTIAAKAIVDSADPIDLATGLEAMGGLPVELASIVLRHAIDSRRLNSELLRRLLADEGGSKDTLRVPSCALLTARGVVDVMQHALSTLVVSGVYEFDDSALRTVVERAPLLETLDVSSCWRWAANPSRNLLLR